MEDLYKVKTQQGFSQHSIFLNLKDANTINDIFVRNRIWHTITDPDGKETAYWTRKLKQRAMNTVCTEHEWATQTITTSGGLTIFSTVCRNCGLSWDNSPRPKPLDFKIEENLSEINKLQWEDIEKEYEKSPKFLNEYYSFTEFLKENYEPPEKKNKV